jgi:rhodanese-related sulfurtransferase
MPTLLPSRPARATPTLSRRSTLTGLAAGLLGLSGLAACGDAASQADGVSLEAARQALTSGSAVVIDIREPAEHATGVAAGARLLPMRQLATRLAEIPLDPGKPVLLICNTQNRSRATLKALRERGYGHVRFVDGGMSEWARRGWPLVAPR